MECGEVDAKKEEDVDENASFDGLLQNFTHHISKVVGEGGYQKPTQFSDHLILNPTFPKYVAEPLERYLCISPTKRLDAFFESLRPFEIIIGIVSSITSGQHVYVKLIHRIDGQRRFISDLNIVGAIDPQSSKSCLEDEDPVKVGDKVKGVVTYVNRSEKVIHMSFQEKYLREDQIRHFPLGKLCDDEEGESSSCVIDNNNQVIDSMAFVQDLERSSDFIDPHSIKRLLNQLKLPEECISFLGNSSYVTVFESADIMREKQSSKWSMDMVGAGVKHFREKRLKEALKCFDQSISFYPKNVEAFVARGALKANQNELKDAVEDFREALQINPKHRNARKYIIETLSTIAKRYEKDMKWSEASHSYQDILDIDGDNKEALKQYSQIKQILRPKSIPTKPSKQLSPGKSKTLSIKSKERLKKLKNLLQAETVGNKSSSSSSSSSSSDSNSSDEEKWIEKPNAMVTR